MILKTYVLGISAFYHNSAAALICNGKILAAAEEERFTRIKGDASFPINAVKFCLDSAGIYANDLCSVAFYEKPAEKFARILTGAVLNAPRSISQFVAAVPDWISSKLWVEKNIRKNLDYKGRIVFVPHHLSHAAAAFYPSPYTNAAILTLDGAGEWSTSAWGTGKDNAIEIKESMRFPNSIGLLYSAFTYYTGFKINDGEYKMMGLAPYGKPVYARLIKENLVDIKDDGSFFINQHYFSYAYGVHTVNRRFEALFERKARTPEEKVDSFYADIAASIQNVTNEIMLKTAKHIQKMTGQHDLVMAGGVALNITSNGLLARSGIFDDIWIQPAAGDSGGAIGAALEEYYRVTNGVRVLNDMGGCYLGKEIKKNDKEASDYLHKKGAKWQELDDSVLVEKVAGLLAAGKTIGIARERAEFGPRALGNRSILADSRDPEMLQRLNMKIKFREGFRPFAPVVIEEDAPLYFETGKKTSPYMLFSFPVKEDRRLPLEFADSLEATASLARSDIPAVTHIDYSARIQTVNEKTAPFLYAVLLKFRELTGCSVLINTSFNVSHMPIVNDEADAFDCFMRSGLDYAVIGNRFFDKRLQAGRIKK